ncbi:c-type cytochrome [Sphingobium nicotianae]|uniref:C-type cytochrome n=1 Tax=Sphingobium nicotianae TaxID=2782607 RepID=A0A9X1ISM7_9SPHN|nr:c-type cytochrome [Sphingobium nicotianae]MBT2188653.1 c-type cytochrome [Sphingobium nicotianae]
MRHIALGIGLCLTIGTAVLAAQPRGSVERGRQIYAQCAACHSMDGSVGVGPSLRGVYGRRAGGGSGFSYSPALKSSGIIWDAATLDAFLRAPQRAIPRNKMPYAGMAGQGDRQDVIAYLAATR